MLPTPLGSKDAAGMFVLLGGAFGSLTGSVTIPASSRPSICRLSRTSTLWRVERKSSMDDLKSAVCASAEGEAVLREERAVPVKVRREVISWDSAG